MNGLKTIKGMGMSYCNNCQNNRMIDVRLPYKQMHELAMTKYAPLFIACPTCAKDYKCEKCGSKNTKLLFSKFALDKYSDQAVVKCNDCNKRDTDE